jgi:hypothetical protein
MLRQAVSGASVGARAVSRREPSRSVLAQRLQTCAGSVAPAEGLSVGTTIRHGDAVSGGPTFKVQMMKDSKRLFVLAVLAGAACGGALVATTMLTRNGWSMLLPYVALGLATAVYLRSRHIEAFSQRFVLPFGAYVVATLIIEVYLNTAANPQRVHTWTLWTFLGPLGAMLLIVGAASAVVAVLARSSRPEDGLRHGRVGT